MYICEHVFISLIETSDNLSQSAGVKGYFCTADIWYFEHYGIPKLTVTEKKL